MERKNKIKVLTILLVFLFVISTCLICYSFSLNKKYKNELQNDYNESFSNLVNFVNSSENYLAKALISKSSYQASKNLTQIWRDSNLAMVYLTKIPFNNESIGKISKFLNQLSDYSYYLSKKTLEGNELDKEDFENLSNLYEYAKSMESNLNELSEDLYENAMNWDEIKKDSKELVQQVDNSNVLAGIDEKLNNYEGLIYDGAYSDHVNKAEKYGLDGQDIDVNKAKEIVENYFKTDYEIKEINFISELTNADIPSYCFDVKISDDRIFNIIISKKGGHVVQISTDREINEENKSIDEILKNAKEYLKEKGFDDMKETYYIKSENILTVNYVYIEDDVYVYPDLIKVKIALDNGEVLGLEAIGYLNSHKDRFINKDGFIDINEAKKYINEDLNIFYEGLAIIPTEWKTEIICYEFKGEVKNKKFIVYVNARTGKEEDILVILDTPGGTLTS